VQKQTTHRSRAIREFGHLFACGLEKVCVNLLNNRIAAEIDWPSRNDRSHKSIQCFDQGEAGCRSTDVGNYKQLRVRASLRRIIAETQCEQLELD